MICLCVFSFEGSVVCPGKPFKSDRLATSFGSGHTQASGAAAQSSSHTARSCSGTNTASTSSECGQEGQAAAQVCVWTIQVYCCTLAVSR